MPGKWFGVEGHIRIGFGTPADFLKRGLSHMEDLFLTLR